MNRRLANSGWEAFDRPVVPATRPMATGEFGVVDQEGESQDTGAD